MTQSVRVPVSRFLLLFHMVSPGEVVLVKPLEKVEQTRFGRRRPPPSALLYLNDYKLRLVGGRSVAWRQKVLRSLFFLCVCGVIDSCKRSLSSMYVFVFRGPDVNVSHLHP